MRTCAHGDYRSEIAPIVARAFQKIRSYIQTKRINDPAYHPERVLLAGRPGIEMNLLWVAQCDGSEDLTVIVGEVPSEKIDRWRIVKRKFSDSPSFYWLESSQDPFTPTIEERNKAVIWIEDPSIQFTRQNSGIVLEALLTHELLHTAGSGHVPATIMDEEMIVETLRQFDPSSEKESLRQRLLSIDWSDGRELILCDTCPISGDFQMSVDMKLRVDGTAFDTTLKRGQKVSLRIDRDTFKVSSVEFSALRLDGGALGDPVFQVPVLVDGQWSTVKSRSRFWRYVTGLVISDLISGVPTSLFYSLWRNHSLPLEMESEDGKFLAKFTQIAHGD